MERSPTNDYSYLSPSENKNTNNFTALKIALLEIAFIIASLCVFFFLLNYLNIISLRQIFPILAMLPHRAIYADSTVHNVSSNPYGRDLEDFIISTVKAEYLPSTFDFQYQNVTLSPNGTVRKVLGLNWTTQKFLFYSNIFTPGANNTSSYIKLYIFLADKNYSGVPIDSTLATSITNTFFILPTSLGWKCAKRTQAPNNTITYCESVQRNATNDVGYGVALDTGSTTKFFTFACLIPVVNRSSQNAQSCLF